MYKEIGNRITEIRKSKGMSKRQFAVLIGMSDQYLGTLENGEHCISTEKLIQLCKITGASADYILFGNKHNLNPNIKNYISKIDSSNLRESFEVIENIITMLK